MTATLEAEAPEDAGSEIPEETALYHIFGDEDLLLYIGISNDFGRRWKQEAATFPWWDEKRRMATHWYPSRPEAAAAETAAIKAEHPKYNITHNLPVVRARKTAPAPPDPDWIPVRIPDDEGFPVHPLDRFRPPGPRLPHVFTFAERQMSSASFAESMIADLPEESRGAARARLDYWRLNYQTGKTAWALLQDLYVREVTEERPEVLALIRETRAECFSFLGITCPCCDGKPPAGMTCSECASAGPAFVIGPRRWRSLAIAAEAGAA